MGKTETEPRRLTRLFTLPDASLRGHVGAERLIVNECPLPYLRSMRVRTYVITSDDGSAPNYEPPFATLAICKPRIRRNARPGEMVIAFNGARLHPESHSVRWAGIVSEILPLGDYWDDARFRNKRPERTSVPDNIYRPSAQGLNQVINPIHRPEHAATDIGGINVLIFGRHWYFGAFAPIAPESLGLWMTGGRRHEPCHDLRPEEWQALLGWLDDVQASVGAVELPLGDDGNCGSCTIAQRPAKRPVC